MGREGGALGWVVWSEFEVVSCCLDYAHFSGYFEAFNVIG